VAAVLPRVEGWRSPALLRRYTDATQDGGAD